MTFRVGQKVVCVDATSDLGWGETEALIKGGVYTVSLIFIDDDGEVVFHLVEVRRDEDSIDEWGPFAGYGAFRFRPIVERKTDISCFTKMLTGTKIGADA